MFAIKRMCNKLEILQIEVNAIRQSYSHGQYMNQMDIQSTEMNDKSERANNNWDKLKDFTQVADQLKQLGNQQYKTGQFNAALSTYLSALHTNQNNPLIYTNVAEVLEESIQWGQRVMEMGVDIKEKNDLLFKCQNDRLGHSS